MPRNKSLKEEQSELETNLKMSSLPPIQIRKERRYLLSSSTERSTSRDRPDEVPLSYESLGANYPADKVERYFS